MSTFKTTLCQKVSITSSTGTLASLPLYQAQTCISSNINSWHQVSPPSSHLTLHFPWEDDNTRISLREITTVLKFWNSPHRGMCQHSPLDLTRNNAPATPQSSKAVWHPDGLLITLEYYSLPSKNAQWELLTSVRSLCCQQCNYHLTLHGFWSIHPFWTA